MCGCVLVAGNNWPPSWVKANNRTCSPCNRARSVVSGALKGRASKRLFGDVSGWKPHQSRWDQLPAALRKVELAKQRQIDAENGVADQQAPPSPSAPPVIPPELARIREMRRKAYAKADAKVAASVEGYVYAIGHPRYPKHFKLGRSGDPYSRLAAANTWCPDKAYYILHMEYFDDCVVAEAAVHQLLDLPRVDTTEWFEITAHDAIRVLKTIQERN